MSPDLLTLARRAVACKGWRWMPGMLAADGPWWGRVGCGFNWREDAEVLPDLSDPATLGCLLALVREAHHEPLLHTRPDSGGWYIEREAEHDHEWLRADGSWGEGADPVIWHTSEAEALVAGLEAAS